MSTLKSSVMLPMVTEAMLGSPKFAESRSLGFVRTVETAISSVRMVIGSLLPGTFLFFKAAPTFIATVSKVSASASF